MIRRIAPISCALLASLCGCAAKNAAQSVDRPAIQEKPHIAELPHFAESHQTLPVKVGVEEYTDEPRIVYVPSYEEPELTPEEKKAVGEDKEPVFDELVFRKPQRGPEHGVSSLRDGMAVSHDYVGAVTRAGRSIDSTRITGVGFRDGATYEITVLPRLGAAALIGVRPSAVVGEKGGQLYGEGSARTKAAAHSRIGE